MKVVYWYTIIFSTFQLALEYAPLAKIRTLFVWLLCLRQVSLFQHPTHRSALIGTAQSIFFLKKKFLHYDSYNIVHLNSFCSISWFFVVKLKIWILECITVPRTTFTSVFQIDANMFDLAKLLLYKHRGSEKVKSLNTWIRCNRGCFVPNMWNWSSNSK